MRDETVKNDLVNASLLAFGWIIGRGGWDEPPALALALALRDNGVESSYIDHYIGKAMAAMSAPAQPERTG